MVFKIGMGMIGLTCLLFLFSALKLSKEHSIKEEAMTTFWKDAKVGSVYNYVAILEINKINLRQGLFNIGDKFNDVNENVEIFKDSVFPDVDESNIILMGHSGNDKHAYFNNLDKLEIHDVVNFYYNDIKYVYRIMDIYKQDKTGFLDIKTYKTKMITLITCSKNSNEQVIYSGEIITEERY